MFSPMHFFSADLDPIYFCELLKVCHVFDGGDATITSLEVHPASGERGKLRALCVPPPLLAWRVKNI